MRLLVLAVPAALFLMVSTGCGDDGGGVDGETLYRQPLASGNSFACATCHALDEPASDGIRRPGHQIGDATKRTSYKNGQLTNMLDAVNTCLVEWMTAEPWSADDERWLALRGFLDEQAPAGAADNINVQIVDPPTDLGGGDITAGRTLFNSSCIGCHGMDAVGTQRAPILVGSTLDADYIAERVRKSGQEDSPTYPNLSGGRMPFWGADRLSDDELRDVIAFVQSNDPTPMTPDAGVGNNADAGPSNCGTSHPRVGQTAQLTTIFHGVSGTATIVDDCTIRFDMFNYDGLGIDVRIYGGLGGNYTNGFAMTDDLLLPGGYNNATITATVPPGKTLDDLDGVSVWCVTVGQNFGDATFPAP